MRNLIFATTNSNKFHSATIILAQFGIAPVQRELDILEIQSENSEAIARDKAQKAFNIIGKPIVITDDSWSIAGLRGFPGAYMKSINHWFTAEDFLRLTLPLVDRRVALHQYVVYQDVHTQKLFRTEMGGTLTREIRGPEMGEPAAQIISLSPDGQTIAERRAQGHSAIAAIRNGWHELGEWLAEQSASNK